MLSAQEETRIKCESIVYDNLISGNLKSLGIANFKLNKREEELDKQTGKRFRSVKACVGKQQIIRA